MITLTDIDPGRIFQRYQGKQVIDIAVTFDDSPTSIEARVVLDGTSTEVVTWTTIDSAPSGGASAGTLTVPQGGWYNLQVREVGGDADQDDGSNAWGVGILVALAPAQSNMVQWKDPMDAGDGTTAAHDLLRTLMRDHPARTYLPGWHSPPTLTARGQIEFGNRLCAVTGLPVGLLDWAVGGTAIMDRADPTKIRGNWTDEGDALDGEIQPYPSFRDECLVTVTGASHTGPKVEMAIQLQGEADAAYRTRAEYKAADQAVIAKLRADVDHSALPVFISPIVKRSETLPWTEGAVGAFDNIVLAQLDVIAADIHVYRGANMEDMLPNTGWYDADHYDIDHVALNAARVADTVLKTLYPRLKPARTFSPVRYGRQVQSIIGDTVTLVPFQVNTLNRTVRFEAQAGDVLPLVSSDSRITFTDTGDNPITSITAASDGVQSVSIKVLVDLTTDTSELYATWSLIGSEDHTSAAFNVSTNVLTVSGREGFRAYLADGSGGWTFVKRAPQHSSDLDLTGLLSDGWNEIMIRPGTLDGPDIWLGWVWYSVVSESVQRLAAEPVARHKAKAVSYTHDAGEIAYTHDAAAVGYTHAAEG